MSVKTACGIVGKYFSSSRVFSLSWDIAMLKTYVMSSKRTKVKNTDRAATINPWLPGREMTWGCWVVCCLDGSRDEDDGQEDGDKDDQDIIVATSTSISTLTTNTKRETKDTTTRTKNNPADQKLRQWNIILKNCVSPARNYNFVSSETINLGSVFCFVLHFSVVLSIFHRTAAACLFFRWLVFLPFLNKCFCNVFFSTSNLCIYSQRTENHYKHRINIPGWSFGFEDLKCGLDISPVCTFFQITLNLSIAPNRQCEDATQTSRELVK